MLFTLFGVSTVWAENSSDGWSFSVLPDGTARLSYPIEEIWVYNDRSRCASTIFQIKISIFSKT